MLHARLFQETAKFRAKHFRPLRASLDSIPSPGSAPPASEQYLDGRQDVDRPLTVQFCANDPEELLEAAKYVQPYCDAVDLNLGCPQGIAKRGRYGAFLQEDQDLICRMISTLSRELQVPITAKIRILETKEMTLSYAKRILDAGASILTVHGRRREQKGHLTGLADWSVIRYLRENLPTDTVIFANGNILRHEDIVRCLAATGADGVMSAEGNLYDPTIFADVSPKELDGREYWQGRDGRGGYRMDFVFRRYMSIIYKYVLDAPEPERLPLYSPTDPNQISHDSTNDDLESQQPPSKRQKKEKRDRAAKRETPADANLSAMQAHLFHLLRPLVSVHTEVRDALARSRSGDIAAFENVLHLTERAVKQGLQEYKANPEKFEDISPILEDEIGMEDITDHESSLKAVRACKRPWWVCQSYVRPVPKEAVEKGSITLSKQEKKARLEAASTAEPGVKLENSRPKQDVKEGLDPGEVAAPAMVCG